MRATSRSRSAAEISFSSSVSRFGTAFSSIAAYPCNGSTRTIRRAGMSAMVGTTSSFIAMRTAFAGAMTLRRMLQPAPPHPTMATRAGSSPMPSCQTSATDCLSEVRRDKDCLRALHLFIYMDKNLETAIRRNTIRRTVDRGIPREAEVVVVGGGCMGASIAFHLARRDVDVVLLERGHIASGATGHSGALVRQHYEARIGIRLARESLAFFRRFEKETGFDCDFRT
ncbi:MAG: FAD-binding oxidoreductase, partial [Methanobacteriota archaeon]